MNRNLILAAIGALIVGFGAGLLNAKITAAHTPSVTQVSTNGGL
jgi:hypothetical protein